MTDPKAESAPRTHPAAVTAARLHGAKDIRIEQTDAPTAPANGQAVIRVGSVGICGSDLHTYEDGRIGDTVVESPLVLGHEFGGIVETVGPDAADGVGQALSPGTRVAVDPAIACGRCELCTAGHPNLCPHHTFMGVWPTHGALRERMTVPARCCFPVPDGISDDEIPMLETLGVAIHAVDLAHLRVGDSAAVIGAGSIGLCVAQVAALAGASPVFVTDRLPWRLDLARELGAAPIHFEQEDAAKAVMRATAGRGVDVAFEAAWSSDDAIAQAVDMLRPGGRLVVVGIAGDDRLSFRHSAVRRKGLTIALCRRMKHTYPRAIAMTRQRKVDLSRIVTHRYPLTEADRAIACAAGYEDGAVKVVVRCGG